MAFTTNEPMRSKGETLISYFLSKNYSINVALLCTRIEMQTEKPKNAKKNHLRNKTPAKTRNKLKNQALKRASVTADLRTVQSECASAH